MKRACAAWARALLWALALASLCAGCGLGALQTAKTTPQGRLAMTVGGGYMHNENVKQQNSALGNFVQHVALRYGLTERLDVGARLLFMTGLLADVKFNLMPPDSPLALSLQGGVGAAVNSYLEGGGPSTDGWTFHLPLGLLASYRLGRWSPYVGLSYGFWWVFDRDVETEAGLQYADRAGHGDGVLTVTAGLELAITESFAILLEYDLLEPVVDDPGDFYSFVRNHLLQVGFRY